MMLLNFDDFVTSESWNNRFYIPLEVYIEQAADVNLKIFMGMYTKEDMIGVKKVNKKATIVDNDAN